MLIVQPFFQDQVLGDTLIKIPQIPWNNLNLTVMCMSLSNAATAFEKWRKTPTLRVFSKISWRAPIHSELSWRPAGSQSPPKFIFMRSINPNGRILDSLWCGRIIDEIIDENENLRKQLIPNDAGTRWLSWAGRMWCPMCMPRWTNPKHIQHHAMKWNKLKQNETKSN